MKIKKIITILMLILLCISCTISNAAFSIDSADIYIKERAKTCLLVASNGGPIGVTKVFYSNNGKSYPAYCINPNLDGVGEYPGYSVTVTDVVNNPQVWRVITQGYPYKSLAELGVADEDEAYTATKQAVYCVINNYDLSRYLPTNNEAGQRTLNAMTRMVNYARTSTNTKPSSNITIKENSEWIISETNDYIIKEFSIITEASAPEYQLSISNDKDNQIKILDMNNNETNKVSQNKFKVKVPTSLLNENNEFAITVKANLETYPILYGKSSNPNLQSYALTGEKYEIGEGTITIKYSKNENKIRIIKIDKENKNRLSGVEFNILDENQNIIYSNLKTNENGEIIIENIKPGKYFLEETSSINQYNILKEKVEFDITLNEEITLTIENEKEVEKKTTEKTYSETIKKLPVTGM